MDASNDALVNVNACLEQGADFIIKRNLRRESPEEWLMIAQQNGMCCEERNGKRFYLGAMEWNDRKLNRPIRVVYQVIERTIEASERLLLVPEIEVHIFFTTLDCSPWQVIRLYRECHQ